MSEDKIMKVISKIDREYLSQYPSDRQGPARLAIGAYQAGDLEFCAFKELLFELESLARENGFPIENEYFSIVGKYGAELFAATELA